MKLTKTILTIAALIVLIVFDLLLWINAYVDGKYLIEPYMNNQIEETYYMWVESLSIAMFVNLGIVIVLLITMLYRKKRNKEDKEPNKQ
ncbi:MAG: hypothetical protein IJV05_04910 [Muribaculaceae bacterium]|nr:hypothetical protein [Muribaculaceae bacterium]